MNKLELIATFRDKTKLTKTESSEIVNIFFDALTKSLIKKERIEIRGFCSFFVKSYKSYIGRNPKTGKPVQIPPKKLPFFKCGKDLKERVNS